MSSSAVFVPEPAVPAVNSPAAAVKAGRDRGASVLAKLRAEEQAQVDAEAAAAAKRRKSPTVTTLALVGDAQLATVETVEDEAMHTGYSDDSGSDDEWTPDFRGSVSTPRGGATASKSRSRGAKRAVQV